MDAHCYLCQAYKPIQKFHRDRTRTNKHCSRCKECDQIYERQRNRNGPRPRQTPALTRPVGIIRQRWNKFDNVLKTTPSPTPELIDFACQKIKGSQLNKEVLVATFDPQDACTRAHKKLTGKNLPFLFMTKEHVIRHRLSPERFLYRVKIKGAIIGFAQIRRF